MKRFMVGVDRGQSTLLPECVDDWIDESNPVRAVDAFVDGLDLARLGFEGVVPEVTGRPSYHPSALLKLYIYGYLNRVQSSRRLEREAGRNLEVIWLLGRLAPDDKTIADFRKDNGSAIRKVCAQFIVLCREVGLLTKASVAIDGSKFKAVNNRDRNFTRAKARACLQPHPRDEHRRREAAPGGDTGLRCGSSQNLQVHSGTMSGSFRSGSRPATSQPEPCFGPFRNVFAQPRPEPDMGAEDSRNGTLWNIGLWTNGLLRLDVGRPDHFAPLLSLFGDELAEVGRRHW
jgi:transposase